jgi:hypothetical protein
MVTSLVLHRFNAKGRSFVASTSRATGASAFGRTKKSAKSKQMEAFSDTAHD